VGNPTLVRFFALHYLLPFVVLFLVVLHFFYLHVDGRSNPLGISSSSYKVYFHSFFSLKDFLGFVVFGLVFMYFTLVLGYKFIDAENFIPANPLVTPTHIQPEWYFLFAYAILRRIPNKLGGVAGLVFSILILFFLPFLTTKRVGGVGFSTRRRVAFWMFCANFFVLT
jgi:ubiquinol-cytochrome c reductase cytochrome b subunit